MNSESRIPLNLIHISLSTCIYRVYSHSLDLNFKGVKAIILGKCCYICMMKYEGKILRNALAGLMMAGSLGISLAETVSQKEASKVAQSFLNQIHGEVTAPAKMVWNGRNLTTSRLFAPFYVYNSPKGGFVIISAENKAYPVLGYSRTETFNKDRLGEEEKKWLKGMAREIELVRYDSREPSEAITAWGHLPAFITQTLENPYGGNALDRLSEEERDVLEQIDRRNSWVLMPRSVEYAIYDPQEGEVYLDDITLPEEKPFSLFEDFVALIKEEEAAREQMYERRLNPVESTATFLGGGHYELFIPEGAVMMRLYSLTGSLETEKYYSHTSSIPINIEHMPSGYYVAMVLGENGEIHSFKLGR